MTRNLLLIDDDGLTREVLSLLLEQHGWTVYQAENGTAAVQQLRQGLQVDTVMSDLQMPGLSGRELSNELRSICAPPTRLIAMTATIKSAETLGFDRVLQKPINAAMLETGAPISEIAGNADLSEETFAALTAKMQTSQIGALYDFALQDMHKRVESLRALSAIQDDAAFRAEAHAVKGSAAMVGAQRIQHLAGNAEEEGITVDTASSINQIVKSMEQLRSILAKRIPPAS